MSSPLERLEAEALELTARERAAPAHRLIVSLDEAADENPTEVELAWEKEIQQRLDAYRQGELQPVPSADWRSRIGGRGA
jgi:putative addiction module component (TIGR02574 family)